jgi:hypothetical protein
MDVEHENGVRLAACQPNQLVLHLPPAYVSKVKKWQHVTATNGFHVCDHAKDRPVYHRIKEVELTKHHETPKGGRTAVLTTQELDSPSEVIPQLDFAYSLIPIESLKEHEQEAAKNLYDERLRAMTEHSDRRLYDRNFDDDEGYGKFERSKNQLKGYNDFSPAAAGTDDRNWRPLSHAKFGWNWNYRTNTVRNPQFKFHIPSIRGIALLKNPFLKFVGGLNVQFQSQWDDVNPFQTPPRVNIMASVQGTADINLDLGIMASVTKDSKVDPFGTGTFDVFAHNPNFRWARKVYWFDQVPKDWMIAGVPITLIPGIHCGLKIFHNGIFQGSVRGGVNTKARLGAVATYNSYTGLDLKFKVDALNTRLLPPTWMIFTKHFEVGAFFDPTIFLKGHIGPIFGKLGIGFKPRVSASILAAGERAFGLQQQELTKELVVYPFRVIGLPPGEEWSVGIQANGRSIMTSTKMPTRDGVIEFHDYVDHFRFGLIDERDLSHHPIYIVLFRLGQFQAGLTQALYCNEVVQFVCQPNPTKATFEIAGKPVVVQLTMAWRRDPTSFLEKHIKSVSMVFPKIVLEGDASKDFDRRAKLTDPSNPSLSDVGIIVKVRRLGQVYAARANAHPGVNVQLTTNRTQALGVQWTDAWRVNYGSITGADRFTEALEPQIEVWYESWYNDQGIKQSTRQEYLQAKASLRNVDFATEVYNDLNERFQLVQAGSFYTSGPRQPWGSGEIGFAGHDVKASSRFLYPGWSMHWEADSSRPVYWSTEHGYTLVHSGKAQQFRIEVLAERIETGGRVSYLPVPQEGQNVLTKDLRCNPEELKIPFVEGDNAFADYGSECHFSSKITIPLAFKDSVVRINIFWVDPEDPRRLENVLRSPGITILAKVAPVVHRKLQDGSALMDEAVERGTFVNEESSSRQLRSWEYGLQQVSSEVAAHATNQLHPICIKKELSYRLHLGIDYRVFLEDLRSTGAITPFKWLNSLEGLGQNVFDTGNRPIWEGTPVETFLDKLLPQGLCSGGVCSGELPGCPGDVAPAKFMGNWAYNKEFVYPPTPNQTLELELSRPFKWTEDSKAAAAGSLAFGMALMPEVIRIGSLVLTSMLPDHKKHINKPGDVDYKGDIIWTYSGSGAAIPCKFYPEPICVSEFIYRGQAVTGCTIQDMNYRGWCSLDRLFSGNWRQCYLACNGRTLPEKEVDIIVDKLRAKAESEPWNPRTRRLSEKSDEATEANRFLVSFQPGSLNYGLTDDFIRKLIRRQSFRGIEDGREAELGEVKITGFRIHSGNTPEVGKTVLLPAPTDIEKFEANYTRQKGDPIFEIKKSVAELNLVAEEVASRSYEMPLFALGLSIVALIAVVVGIVSCIRKSHGKTAYSEITLPEEVNME